MKKSKSFKPSRAGNSTFVKKRLYDDQEWVDYRRKFLKINPNCYACGTHSQVVDHVLAHKNDKEKFWNPTNMIPLCKMCHDYVTGNFDKHIPPKTESKMKWISWKRVETETYVKVKIVEREKT